MLGEQQCLSLRFNRTTHTARISGLPLIAIKVDKT
jgi:hypothetical protein